jgi:tRNA(fMet)-specific endonuclease VapC
VTRIVLDTDMVTLLREGHPAVGRRFPETGPGEVGVTVITVEEQLAGWFALLRKSSAPEKMAFTYAMLAATVKYYAGFPILSFGLPAIARYHALKGMRLNVGSMDLKIAAIALEANCAVVTRNVRDFRRVPGLNVEDWSG